MLGAEIRFRLKADNYGRTEPVGGVAFSFLSFGMSRDTLARVLRYISLKPRTRKEIEEYMSRKLNLSEEEKRRVIASLQESGLIDDEFAKQSYIRSRVAKGFGRKYIKHKLSLKGIKAEDEEIQTDLGKVTEIVLRRYGERIRGEERSKVLAKVYNFLSYRGFSREEILEVMRRILGK